MEFGARALGNRSILANPCDKNIKEIINKKIKEEKILDLLLLQYYMKKKINGFIVKNLIPICQQLN